VNGHADLRPHNGTKRCAAEPKLQSIEYGVEGLEEYLETKAILGYGGGQTPAAA